jgi:hypothetical protein
MDLYLENVHRWGEVTFGFDKNSAKDLLAIPGESAHLLESFGVYAPKCNTEVINEICPILPSFPNLRRLRWCSDYTPTTLLNMSFSKLTHINLECPLPFNECVRFIAQCLQIRELELEEIGASPVPMDLPVVTLPDLFLLSVRVGDSAILDYFTLPSLRSLRFPGIKLQKFEKLMARSSGKLESFCLKDSDGLTEEEVIYYLRMPCLQSLRELSINAMGLTDRTLTLLQYSGSETSILPDLEHLSIEGCETTDGVVSDMIASRWFPNRVCREAGSPASLKSIFATFDGMERDIECSKLQEFSAGGLEVWSTYTL